MSFRNEFDPDNANLSYFCRKCRNKVRGIIKAGPVTTNFSSDTDLWLILKCPTQFCELSFVIYDNLNSRIRRVYPFPEFEADDYNPSIPEKVRKDIAEAKRCFYADAYKGCVTMYRRAIQNIVLDKISDPGIEKKKLWEQIDELFNKEFITKHLQETAHEIRHFGNYGAHPSDDLLDDVSEEDAEMIENIASDLIVSIYVTPEQTKKLKEKRSQSK